MNRGEQSQRPFSARPPRPGSSLSFSRPASVQNVSRPGTSLSMTGPTNSLGAGEYQAVRVRRVRPKSSFRRSATPNGEPTIKSALLTAERNNNTYAPVSVMTDNPALRSRMRTRYNEPPSNVTLYLPLSLNLLAHPNALSSHTNQTSHQHHIHTYRRCTSRFA